MSMAQHKQRSLALILFIALLVALLLGLVGFEVNQHMSSLWHVYTAIDGIVSTNIIPHHP